MTFGLVTVGSKIPSMIGRYYDRLLLDNLYPDLYFYQFGEKRKVPASSGRTLVMNKWVKLPVAAAISLTEGTAIVPSGMSSFPVSATLSGFAVAVKHADFVIMTAISDTVAAAVQETSKTLALKVDTRIRQLLSSKGTLIGASGKLSGATGVTSGKTLAARDIVKAVRILNNNNAKTYPDGNFAGILHPWQIYNLQSDTSTGGWIDVNKYASNDTVQNIYRGEIGQLYGVRVVRSSNARALFGAGSAGQRGTSGSVSGFQAMIMGPGAYGVAELDEGSARVFVKQLGSGGTSDPVNQLATIGAKVYFAPVDLDTANRLVVIVSGKNQGF